MGWAGTSLEWTLPDLSLLSEEGVVTGRSSACSSPNYVTSSVRTYVRTCAGRTHTRRWNGDVGRSWLLRTAPSSRRTNKRTFVRTYGASFRSKSTDVGALRRCNPCICRPFRPLCLPLTWALRNIYCRRVYAMHAPRG